jgi:RHS repeat-associated protein
MSPRMSVGRVVLAACLSVAVVASGVVAPPAVAAGHGAGVQSPAGQAPSVPGEPLPVRPSGPDPEDAPPPVLPAPRWPSPGSVEVALARPAPADGARAAATATAPAAPVRAGGLPALVAPVGGGRDPVGGVRVEALDQATARRLGAAGLALRLHRADGGTAPGPVSLTLDYSGFRHAFGGNFADRLRVLELPACALSSPATPSCRAARPVRSDNDLSAGRITATVAAVPEPAAGSADSAGVVVLAAAAAGSSTGDFRATDLRASGKWEVGLQSGSFTYDYPIDLPPPPYGKAPELSLEYNSGSVDGRTSAENTQASFVGLGWELNPGFIERKYKPCSEDADGAAQQVLKTWGDLCWDSPYKGKDDGAVYHISLNGQSGELLWDGSGYRMRDDQDWKIQHLTSGGKGADDEYWVITTQDGTRYVFGYGQDPTKSTGNATNSVWTVPVIGDDAGEPCHASDDPHQMASCKQAYRWNLDRVIDPNENEAVFYYSAESNAYERVESGNDLIYTRGGYLDKIEYGLREDLPKDTPAPDWVDFVTVNRCKERTTADDPFDNPPADCPTVASSPSSYPDVPTDLICSSGCSEHAPSFFVTDRLEHVTSYVRKLDGTAGYDPVTTYQLKMAFPATDDGTDPPLWLDYVRRIGRAVGDSHDLKLPVTDFNGTNFNNRVDPGSDKPLSMRRITTVQSDLGSETQVTYGHQNPCQGWDSKNWASNADECFRVFFQPEGGDPKWGVFNKYVVTKVVDHDRIGGQPDQVSTYQYLYGAGWHFDDDLSRSTEHQSWSDWRGYQTIQVVEGASADPAQRTITRSTFYRGLDQDRTNKDGSGSPRSESMTDYDGNAHTDAHFLTGRLMQVRRCADLDCTSSADLADERYTYWDSGITANGPGFHNAHMVRTAGELARVPLALGGWRRTETDTTFDSHGLPTQVLDKGDLTDTGDDRCTNTLYARNTDDGRWMIDYPEAVVLHQGDCNGPLAGQTVSLYDGATTPDFAGGPNKPVDGNPTETRSYKDPTTYVPVARSYDRFGRERSETTPNGTADSADDTITTAYLPEQGWPKDGVQVRVPYQSGSALVTTTFPSRRDGAPTKVVDPNNRTTILDYDTLGRLLAVWLPSEPKSTSPTVPSVPSMRFSYSTPFSGIAAPSGPTVVTSQQLQSGSASAPVWQTNYSYLDGFGRTIETQSPSPDVRGGRMVGITRYDDRGLVAGGTDVPAYNSSAAGSGLLNPLVASVPAWTAHAYDQLEREHLTTTLSTGREQWHTTTDNYGDLTVTTPPTGGKTATWTDAAGNVTAVAEDYNPSLPGGPATRYAYTVRDELARITDADGNVSSYAYDWLSEPTSAHDPDAGDQSSVYDRAGNLVWSVDAKGQKVSYTYDALNRRTAQFAGEPGTGTRLAEWTYDSLPGALGEPVGATRFVGGQASTTEGSVAYTSEITGYDDRYRPTGKRITIPATEGALAGGYVYRFGYDKADHLTAVTYPAAGGLPAETVTTTYTALGDPFKLTSDLGGGTTYVKSTAYWGTGQLASRAYGPAGAVTRGYSYEDATGRLSQMQTDTGADNPAAKTTVQKDAYSYDPTGRITAITDQTATVGGAVTPQRQCFGYDGTDRLTSAWTTTAQDCSGGPAAADKLGPDPYKLAYAYDRSGDITQVTSDGTTRAYTYPTPGASAVRPHAVTKVGGDSYAYDANGNLKDRTVAGVSTTLTWNELQQLTAATSAGKTTSFLYDAGGDRVIRRDPNGTTLYLDGMELRLAAGSVKATRYYGIDGGATVAARTPTSLTWLLADSQASVQVAVDAASGQVARQRYLPYGAHRDGKDDIAVTERGFLGKTEDASTGLDQLGARYYDPSIGRFISPDPLTDTDDPQALNPYSYAADNPVSYSDPSGLMIDECGRGGDVNACRNESRRAATHSSGGGGGGGGGGDAVATARQRVQQAQQSLGQSKRLIVAALWGIAKILADVLGITDAVNCLHGELGGCIATAGTIALSLVGGLAGKILSKYGAPWKWRAGARVVKRLVSLGGDIVRGIRDYLRAKRELAAARAALAAARAARVAAPAARRGAGAAAAAGKSAARRVPNPHGRKGGLAHQRTMDKVAKDLRDQGYKVEREVGFEVNRASAGSFKDTRAADVVAYDQEGNMVSVHQVGLRTKTGFPVMRETKAMSDIWSVLEEGVQIVFHPYN